MVCMTMDSTSLASMCVQGGRRVLGRSGDPAVVPETDRGWAAPVEHYLHRGGEMLGHVPNGSIAMGFLSPIFH